jgi:hypothetical protein
MRPNAEAGDGHALGDHGKTSRHLTYNALLFAYASGYQKQELQAIAAVAD